MFYYKSQLPRKNVISTVLVHFAATRASGPDAFIFVIPIPIIIPGRSKTLNKQALVDFVDPIADRHRSLLFGAWLLLRRSFQYQYQYQYQHPSTRLRLDTQLYLWVAPQASTKQRCVCHTQLAPLFSSLQLPTLSSQHSTFNNRHW